MKKLVTLLLSLFALIIPALAQEKSQEIKLDWAALSSGEGALSSGLFFEAEFSRKNDIIGLYLGKEDLAAYYLKSFLGAKVKAGPCLEYFHNSPTLGGMALFLPVKNLSALTWAGMTAGHYGEKVELTRWEFLFFWQQVTYCHKRITASGVALYFEGWHYMADFKYKQPITQEVSLFTSAGYDFFGEGKALLKLGIFYCPKK